ncbi:hypothetical protein CCP1ISM_250003 [Azospirillaceae bacterium]
MRDVFYRIVNVVKDGLIDTSGAVAIGFVNIGDTDCVLNGGVPLLKQAVGPLAALYVQNILWLPINDSERDATAYRVVFSKPIKNPNLLVFIKTVKRDEEKKN